MTPRTTWSRWRRKLGGKAMKGLFTGLAHLGRLHPAAQPARHGLERLTDLAYVADGDPAHTLDVYRPLQRNGLLPTVLYIHGGGFRILSKDTHWLMGLAYAREGFVVANINYRLAPAHPCPAAVEDVVRATLWWLDHARELGGDPERLILAGESAGANLAAMVALLTSYRHPAPWAQELFERNPTITCVTAHCGIYCVSDTARLGRERPLSTFLMDRLGEIERGYLPKRANLDEATRLLADPVRMVEGGPPERPLPPFFLPVGTKDPLLADTRRLDQALEAHGAEVETRIYPGEVHAFHAFIWRRAARSCWRHTFAFIRRHLGTPVSSTR